MGPMIDARTDDFTYCSELLALIEAVYWQRNAKFHIGGNEDEPLPASLATGQFLAQSSMTTFMAENVTMS